MTSRKMEEHLEEQEQPPAKKSQISDPEEQQRGDVGPTDMNADEQNEEPTSSIVRQRLALELECEIFACLELPIQRKFISGLGTEIYEMCAPKIRALLKTIKLFNPEQNGWWQSTNRAVRISPDGLTVTSSLNATNLRKHNIFAMHAFPASSPNHCRLELDNFSGTIIYYFEVKQTTFLPHFRIGFAHAYEPMHTCVLDITYRFQTGCDCDWLIYGKRHPFECFEDAIKPEWKWGPPKGGNVAGCGLLLNSKNQLAIFGTLNGILLGNPFSIKRPVYQLYPTVIVENDVILEANFGTDPAKPFQYDIHKCPSLVFD